MKTPSATAAVSRPAPAPSVRSPGDRRRTRADTPRIRDGLDRCTLFNAGRSPARRRQPAFAASVRLPDATSTPSAVTVPSILNSPPRRPATRARASSIAAGPAAAGNLNGPIAATRSSIGAAGRRPAAAPPRRCRRSARAARRESPRARPADRENVPESRSRPAWCGAAGRALAVLDLDDFLEQPHRRLMRQAVDQRHRGFSIFRASCIPSPCPARAVRSARGHVSRSCCALRRDLRRDDPTRPIHSPAGRRAAAGRPTTSGMRIGAMPIGWPRSGLGAVSSSCRPPATRRRASPSCWRAARSTSPMMPVDAGATTARDPARSRTDSARPRCLMPATPIREAAQSSRRVPAVDLDPGLRLCRRISDAPRRYRRRRDPEADVGIDRSRKATLTTEAQLVADGDAHHRGHGDRAASDTQIAVDPAVALPTASAA